MPITIAVFALILAIILGTYWLFVLRVEDQEDQALKRRLKSARIPRDKTGFVKARENLSSVDALDKLLARSDHVADPIRRLITRSGLKVNVGTIVLACVFCAIATLALLGQLLPLPSILYAVPFALAAGSAPIRRGRVVPSVSNSFRRTASCLDPALFRPASRAHFTQL